MSGCKGCPFEQKMQQTYATLLDSSKRIAEDSERFRKRIDAEIDRIQEEYSRLRKDMFDSGCSRIDPRCEFTGRSPASADRD